MPFLPPVHPGLQDKSLFPAKASKEPALPWRLFADRVPTAEEYERWSNHRGPWGMACGPVSGVVVLDFDGPVGIETLKQLRDEGKLPQTWTATTPRGGIHLYYAISNGCTIKNGVRVLPGMDIKAHGGYVLVPSAFKDGREWQIPPFVEPAPLPDWISNGLGAPATPVVDTPSLPDGFPKPVGKGERNAKAASIAGRYIRRGNSAEETFALLCRWNSSNTPPLPESELRTVVNSITDREARSGQPHLNVVSAAELVATEVGEVPMLISPFLPAGGKAILAAHGGTGKTLLAINIALTVSNDLPLFQRWEIPSPGRVLYVDAESSRPLMTYRLRRVSKGLGVALAGVHLSFPMAKLDVGIRQIREEICREIEEKNARLVILDSFLCFGNLKNENDNTEVRDYLERIGEIPRMTGSSILLIDHAGKPSADKVRAGIRVQPRGASAKRDWADLVMILEERKHESKMLRTLSFDKTRFCATPPSMALEMNHNFTFIPSGEDELCPVTTIKQVVGDHPGITTEELTKMLKKVTGCSIRSAYRGLSRARELNEIEEQTDGRRKHNYLKHMEQQTMPWEEE